MDHYVTFQMNDLHEHVVVVDPMPTLAPLAIALVKNYFLGYIALQSGSGRVRSDSERNALPVQE